MTEAQYLASDDPASMLRWLTTDGGPEEDHLPLPPSDRKLRLFACACCLMRGTSVRVVDVYEREGAPADDMDLQQMSDAEWARAWTEHGMDKPTFAQRAALLRCIVGNPFRPVALPPSCRTPDVLSLAQAAYEQRGRKCGACCGSGVMGRQVSRTIRDVDAKCPGCGGTGTIDDGTLDPARLAVLSDALEEAGCDSAGCIHCGYGSYINMNPPCGCAASELLLHLRFKGLHVRGCWALDLLLGKP